MWEYKKELGLVKEKRDWYSDPFGNSPLYISIKSEMRTAVNTGDSRVSIDKALAYSSFRLSLGINELMHGVVRLSILLSFAANMTKNFEGYVLPGWFVYTFGLILPFLEALLGVTLVLGIFTRWTLLALSLLMSTLIFGTALHSDWTTVGVQMIYVIAYFLAFVFLEHNQYSLDGVFVARKRLR